jgi:hypothetical protein
MEVKSRALVALTVSPVRFEDMRVGVLGYTVYPRLHWSSRSGLKL